MVVLSGEFEVGAQTGVCNDAADALFAGWLCLLIVAGGFDVVSDAFGVDEPCGDAGCLGHGGVCDGYSFASHRVDGAIDPCAFTVGVAFARVAQHVGRCEFGWFRHRLPVSSA